MLTRQRRVPRICELLHRAAQLFSMRLRTRHLLRANKQGAAPGINDSAPFNTRSVLSVPVLSNRMQFVGCVSQMRH